MLEKIDYIEPVCPLCNRSGLYAAKQNAPSGRIPVGRIIEKVDSLFNKNDYTEAGRLLEYWRGEAIALNDKSGELSMESELIGYYRKQGIKEKGLLSVGRALELVEELKQENMPSGATVLINCATAYNAFGMPEDALPLYLMAEMVYKDTLEEGDARFGGLYNNMAIVLSELGYFEEAEKAYHSAVDVMESIPGGEADTAITYINLAHMYDSFNIKEKPEECMKRAHELLSGAGLPHDGYYAFVLLKCAPSFEYFGESELAEKMKGEAEKIYAGT